MDNLIKKKRVVANLPETFKNVYGSPDKKHKFTLQKKGFNKKKTIQDMLNMFYFFLSVYLTCPLKSPFYYALPKWNFTLRIFLLTFPLIGLDLRFDLSQLEN